MNAPEDGFSAGQTVLIKSGAFAAFRGEIEEVDNEKLILTVRVAIFGRSTPVEVEQSQAEITDSTNNRFTSLN